MFKCANITIFACNVKCFLELNFCWSWDNPGIKWCEPLVTSRCVLCLSGILHRFHQNEL